jgi:hypothetical protein
LAFEGVHHAIVGGAAHSRKLIHPTSGKRCFLGSSPEKVSKTTIIGSTNNLFQKSKVSKRIPTASLMRNDLLNTLPVAGVLRGEKVIKMLKKTPKGIQNRGR